MTIFKKAADLRNYLEKQHEQGRKYGFIPTMGALHEGHISLVNIARRNGDLAVCSIFVNPTQFNDPSDFEKYPITLEKDLLMLETAGCDVLFLPSVAEMYPDGTKPTRHYDLGYLETIMEGYYRPGHFQGVSMIVHRLLEIVQPNDLYIGQKDYQQCMVIKKLLALTGFEGQVKLHISPTLREPDGLAMSSRNMRLSDQERNQATAIYQALSNVKAQLKKGKLSALKKNAADQLTKNGFKVDYVEIADADDLRLVQEWDGHQKLVTLAAAYLNGVRLIDNILLN